MEIWDHEGSLERCLRTKLDSSGREARNRVVEIERLRRARIRLTNFCPATRPTAPVVDSFY